MDEMISALIRQRLTSAALCISFAMAALATDSPEARAQQRQWVDISAAIKASSGADSGPVPSPLYLKSGFPKTVKSINLRNTTYTRAVVSWTAGILNLTEKKDLLFNCTEYSYKDNDGTPGYWYNVQWVLPQEAKATIEGELLKYFCKTPSPWQLIAKGVDGDAFYTNMKAAYRLRIGRYGETYTFVLAKVGKYGLVEMNRLYIACKPRKMAIYSLPDAAGDKDISLDETNPDSVGEAMVDMACPQS